MEVQNIISDTVGKIIEDSAKDQNQSGYKSQREEGNKSGRKNRGQTNRNKREHSKEYAEIQRDIRRAENSKDFPNEIIEKVQGEVIGREDTEGFKECYSLTCESILEQFQTDNEELCKKHPSNWNKQLLVQIKRNVPKVNIEDLERLEAVWDVLKELVLSIGLNPTMENFFFITNTYKDMFEKRAELSPEYRTFLEKIYKDSRDSLINDLNNNPYNQTNKIFLAKSVYGIVEKTEPKQIEVHHDIRQYDNLPMFGTSDNNKM